MTPFMRTAAALHGLFVLAACTASAPRTDNDGHSAGPLVVSCCGDADSVIMQEMHRYETTPEARRTPEIAVFPYRSTSGVTVRDRMVIRDAVSWSKLWLNIVGTHSPVPPLPAADFTRETIVVASMGQQRTGGYSMTIDSAGVAGDTVILTVTEHRPGRTCGTTAALTAPIALARVLRPNAQLRLVEKTAVTDCG
jgi:hypothetical protein